MIPSEQIADEFMNELHLLLSKYKASFEIECDINYNYSVIIDFQWLYDNGELERRGFEVEINRFFNVEDCINKNWKVNVY